MTKRSRAPYEIVAVLGALAACSGDRRADPPAVPGPAASPAPPVDPRHAGAIAEAARAYTQWGRVDDRPSAAPELCAPPPPVAQVHMSNAPEAPHDKKLYFLWASDRAAYVSPRTFAPGFTIVKESFQAIRMRDDEGRMGVGPTLEHDGARWKAGAPTALFVMRKVGAATATDGTDAGWIYGTVVGGQVTSAGRVATCMGCHEDATHERLFGLPSRGD